MSAVSNRVMPRSIALWMTLREVSRSVRWPKLLQPSPTAETRRPEPPRLRICMDGPVGDAEGERIVTRTPAGRKVARLKIGTTKKRPRSGAATDGDRGACDLRRGA